MNAFLENGGLRTIRNKFLHLQELVFTTGFEALGIMENEFLVAPENKFVLDVVDSALQTINHIAASDLI